MYTVSSHAPQEAPGQQQLGLLRQKSRTELDSDHEKSKHHFVSSGCVIMHPQWWFIINFESEKIIELCHPRQTGPLRSGGGSKEQRWSVEALSSTGPFFFLLRGNYKIKSKLELDFYIHLS